MMQGCAVFWDASKSNLGTDDVIDAGSELQDVREKRAAEEERGSTEQIIIPYKEQEQGNSECN